MGTFLKTFFICLIISFSFIMYKNFYKDGYSNKLDVSENSPIFKIQNEDNKIPVAPSQTTETPNYDPVEEDKNKEVKYLHTCYFYSNKGALIPISRELPNKPTLESVILVLLKGPMISETQKGIYSEIPANVDLIDVQNMKNTVIINLSSNFGNGGGSESIENRIKQLSKTVKKMVPNKKIYLYINGKEVEYLGGEGVYIKQPL